MSDRRSPGGVERRRLNFVFRSGFVEIRVLARFNKRIVPSKSLLKRLAGYWLLHIPILAEAAANSAIVLAEKKKPASLSTQGGATVHFSRFGGHRHASLSQGVLHDGRMHGPRSRHARLGHALTVGFRLSPCQSLRHEKVVGENVVVGKSANDVADVEAVLVGAVTIHHGPVAEVPEEDIGRIHDSGCFQEPLRLVHGE
jgi:hypothetical protein